MSEGPVLPKEESRQTNNRVSPNGRWFAFMSRADLTGYDTDDAVSGTPDVEVYLYDAQTGRASCASCDPSGARPVGALSFGKNSAGIEANGWLAAGVPSAESNGEVFGNGGENASLVAYQPRYLSDSGRLFFDSNDALVPKDVNGTWDVYEYEPEGVGNCEGTGSTTGSRTYEPVRAFEVEGRKGEAGAGCCRPHFIRHLVRRILLPRRLGIGRRRVLPDGGAACSDGYR